MQTVPWNHSQRNDGVYCQCSAFPSSSIARALTQRIFKYSYFNPRQLVCTIFKKCFPRMLSDRLRDRGIIWYISFRIESACSSITLQSRVIESSKCVSSEDRVRFLWSPVHTRAELKSWFFTITMRCSHYLGLPSLGRVRVYTTSRNASPDHVLGKTQRFFCVFAIVFHRGKDLSFKWLTFIRLPIRYIFKVGSSQLFFAQHLETPRFSGFLGVSGPGTEP